MAKEIKGQILSQKKTRQSFANFGFLRFEFIWFLLFGSWLLQIVSHQAFRPSHQRNYYSGSCRLYFVHEHAPAIYH
jgi:hypothetical protein